MEARPGLTIPKASRAAAELYFGSVRKALAALKSDKRMTEGWITAKIVAELRRLHRRKRPLAYRRVRLNCPALVSAAEAYFGSWGRGLVAAGIDPTVHYAHRNWRKATREPIRRRNARMRREL